MRIWHGVSAIDANLGRTVVTVGNFDGVHRGHRHVLERATDLARELGDLPVVVVTFDPHPLRVLAPEHAPVSLTVASQRMELLAHAGADAVLVLPFTEELAKVSAEDFVRDVLEGALHARGVVVGENFRFGHRAQGNVDLLRRLLADQDVQVVAVPLAGSGQRPWSSSYVRNCLLEGDVESAADALGRLFSVRGVVVRGQQRGRQLGYPTANVPVSGTLTAVPEDGVYAGWLRRLDQDGRPWLPAAISVGTNPTFAGVARQVEAYVLDRDDLELYDVEVEVAFTRRLRGMVAFESVPALIEQMRTDCDRAREILTAPPDQ
jgi:riboflavin kinase / FMN adenylyltransferase